MNKMRWVGIILCICFIFAVLLGAENFYVTTSAASNAKQAYEKILKNCSENNHAFLTKDINGDGVKELFIWQVSDDRQFSRIYKVYTYSRGKAKLLGTVDESKWLYNKGQIYYDKKNRWLVTDDMGTSEVYECYGLNNQSAVLKRSYYCLWKDDTNISLGLNYYMEQGKKRTKILKAKYTAYLKSLKKLSGKVNSKGNRKKYL